MKTCRSCHQDKPADLFHPYPRNRDGLQSYCKACQTEKRRAKYRADPTPYRVEALARYEQRKAAGLMDAEAKRNYDRAYRAENGDKLSQAKQAWRIANADLVRLIRSAYKAKRRAIEKVGDSTATVRTWLAKQLRVCAWCAKDCTDRFHIDHVQPLSRGGRHVVSNLCIACPRCNIKKNAKALDDWLLEIERHRCDVGMLEPA